jgi:hypothetical protein
MQLLKRYFLITLDTLLPHPDLTVSNIVLLQHAVVPDIASRCVLFRITSQHVSIQCSYEDSGLIA